MFPMSHFSFSISNFSIPGFSGTHHPVRVMHTALDKIEFGVLCVPDPVQPLSDLAKTFVGSKVSTGRIVMQLAPDLLPEAMRQYQLPHMVNGRAD